MTLKEYILFLDTETSGVPGNWRADYADRENWPSAIQLAWIILDKDGNEIKRASKYIYDNDISITRKSMEVHGITLDFLRQHGEKRKEVLRKLAHDIKKYNPLIVGHFVEFDIHILSADYFRAHLDNPFTDQTFFCTMLHSKKYARYLQQDSLRLSQLFQHLFNKMPERIHEAENDAELTAQCFLELEHRHELTASEMMNQQRYIVDKLHF